MEDRRKTHTGDVVNGNINGNTINHTRHHALAAVASVHVLHGVDARRDFAFAVSVAEQMVEEKGGKQGK